MKNLTFPTRLRLLIAMLCVLMLGIGIGIGIGMGIGILGMRGIVAPNVALRSVYEDRTVALAQLAEVMRFNLSNEADMVSALADQRAESTQKYLADMQANMEGMAKEWDAYEATYLTPDEKVLADSFKAHRDTLVATALKPMREALEARDFRQAGRLAIEVVPATFLAVRTDIDALLKL